MRQYELGRLLWIEQPGYLVRVWSKRSVRRIILLKVGSLLLDDRFQEVFCYNRGQLSAKEPSSFTPNVDSVDRLSHCDRSAIYDTDISLFHTYKCS